MCIRFLEIYYMYFNPKHYMQSNSKILLNILAYIHERYEQCCQNLSKIRLQNEGIKFPKWCLGKYVDVYKITFCPCFVISIFLYLSGVSLAPRVSGQFAGNRAVHHKDEPVDAGNLHLDVNKHQGVKQEV